MPTTDSRKLLSIRRIALYRAPISLFSFLIVAALLLLYLDASMDKVKLLIANSERGLSNLIERLVLDACFNQAFVETTRIGQADELVKLASSGTYQLVIVAADNLLAPSGLHNSWVSADEAVRAIHTIRSRCETPIIAVAVFPEDEVSLLHAGVECVVRLPFDNEKLKVEVRRALRMADPVEESKSSRWSLVDLVLRGFQRLKSA